MSNDASLGRILKERRRALDLTQAELARRVGCAVVTIKKLEADDLRPSRQIAERLAAVLQIAQDDRTAFVRLARGTPAVDALPSPLRDTPAAAIPPAGVQVKGYTLDEQVGAGGFGVVYRATQASVGRDVAVKIILPHYASRPEFIRRFEAEAQTIARLEHPHIVPLYDYWRDPSGAYLVMRYLRGGNLAARLAGAPLDLDVVLLILDQIGAALMVAHRAGVIHRDVKPGNILLDESGNTYLADFGIARAIEPVTPDDVTHTEVVVGSPAYLSPEQLRDEPVSPQTDQYSLGIVLYELLAGRHPFAHHPPAEQLHHQISRSLPPVSRARPELTALDAVLQRATAKRPAERYPDIAAFVAHVVRAVAPSRSRASSDSSHSSAAPLSPDQLIQPTPDITAVQLPTLSAFEVINPFKGLHAFGEADAEDFFGRGELVARLLERLGQEGTAGRFLAVVGPSGSGKSSVVRAGLVPALRCGALPGSERWFIVELMPGAHPLEEIELGLLRIARRETPALMEQLQRDERGLLRAARLALPEATGELVLVIDQFEELFTLVQDGATRELVLRSLVAAVSDPRSAVRVVVTLRADFYDRPLQHPALGELIQAGTEVVLPMREHEIEQAIVGPATHAGVVLEPGLVPLISHDLGEQPGALPLLQYALTELFERREGRVLTTSAYRALGGVSGALAHRADELYDGLVPEQQVLAREILLRLVTLGEGVEDTRQRVRLAELPRLTDTSAEAVAGVLDAEQQPDASVRAVVEHFSRHRLLTLDRDPLTREPTVEVAHEALLRKWGRLRAWLDEARDDLRVQRRLGQAAAEWAAGNGDGAFLATGARLAQFAALADAGRIALNSDERAYITASLAEQARREHAEQERRRHELRLAQEAAVAQRRAANRLRSLVGALALFLVVAVALSAFAFQQRNAAEANFTRAEAQRLAAEANRLIVEQGNAEVAALLGLRSIALQQTTQGEEALAAAARLDLPQRLFVGHESPLWAVAFSPNGKYLATASDDNTARLWDVTTGAEVLSFNRHTNIVYSLAFSSDGKQLVTGSYDNTARLWDVATGGELRVFSTHAHPVTALALSPDGRTLITGGQADGVAHVWNVSTGKEVQRLEAQGGINGIAFAPDGLHAVTGGEDMTARYWNVQTGETIRSFTGHTDRIWGVAISGDGNRLLTSSFDKTVRLWDIKTGQQLQVFTGLRDAINGVAFSPDDKLVAAGAQDATAMIWNTATGGVHNRLLGHTGFVWSVAFSPDSRSVATASFDTTARLWSVDPAPAIMLRDGVFSAHYSRDGTSVVTAGPAALRVWDSGSRPRSDIFGIHQGTYNDVAWSQEGLLLLAGSTDGTVRLFAAATGRELRVLDAHAGGVYSVAFSPAGRFLLSGGADSTAKLWDLDTGELLRTFQHKENPVFSVAFSPDGQHILTGAYDKTARVWNVHSGAEVRTLHIVKDGAVSVAFSPDGARIATGSWDGTIRLWDATTGAELHQFIGHRDIAWSVEFSPDGKYLVSGSSDRTARLWNVETGAELRRFAGHAGGLFSVGFSPDGRRVITGSIDGTALLWDVDIDDTVAALCSRLLRDFTPEERAQYGIPDDGPTCAAGR
jgi:WD40 repeat protein/serine/threonine protein kinase/DNA-binding XRE family transcriptional regulator